jgi:hypothetical protein
MVSWIRRYAPMLFLLGSFIFWTFLAWSAYFGKNSALVELAIEVLRRPI